MSLACVLPYNKEACINKLSQSPEVREAAMEVIPLVLLTQVLKGIQYSTGGILLGGLDWKYSSAGTCIASVLAILVLKLLPLTLATIWKALSVFMLAQVVVSMGRVLSGTGPWAGLDLFTT